MSEEKKRKLPDPRGFQPLWPSAFETPDFRNRQTGALIADRLVLFLFVATHANRSDREWKGLTIKRGQLLTTYRGLDEGNTQHIGLGWGRGRIRSILRRLPAGAPLVAHHVRPPQCPRQMLLLTISNFDRWTLSGKRTGHHVDHDVDRRLTTGPAIVFPSEVSESSEKEKDIGRREEPKTAPRRRRKWTEEEIENVVTVSTPQEALDFFFERSCKELSRLRSLGRDLPLKPKITRGRSLKDAERLLETLGGSLYVRLVSAYYKTEFTEREATMIEGFPAMSHFSYFANVINERTKTSSSQHKGDHEALDRINRLKEDRRRNPEKYKPPEGLEELF